MADGLITIPGNKNVGKCLDDINTNFEYLDKKIPAGDDVLSKANAYTDVIKNAIMQSTGEALQTKVSKETGKGLSSNDYTDEEKNKLAGIEEKANNYVHPEFPTMSSGIYKVQINNGHISKAVKAEKSDITALGIPSVEDIVCYGTCITDAGNPYKSITLDGFKLVTGAKITVIFSNANTADAITLNVNGTGAKPVYYVGSAMTYRLLKIPAQTGIDFIYDGTNWVYCGQESYVSQTNATDNANYRLLLSYTGDNAQDRASVKKSGNFIANPSTGILNAKYFNATSGGKLLASSDCNGANSTFTISIEELTKYSQLLIRFWTMGNVTASQYGFSEIIPVKYLVDNPNTYIAVGSVLKSVTGSSSGLFDNMGIEIAYTNGNNLSLKTSSYCDSVGYDIYSL